MPLWKRDDVIDHVARGIRENKDRQGHAYRAKQLPRRVQGIMLEVGKNAQD
jgi:hypothetical protein